MGLRGWAFIVGITCAVCATSALSDEIPEDFRISFQEAKKEAEKYSDILDTYRIEYRGIWLLRFWLDDYEKLLDVDLLAREMDAVVLGSELKILYNHRRKLATTMYYYRWDMKWAIKGSDCSEREEEFLFCLLHYLYTEEPTSHYMYLYETNWKARSYIERYGKDDYFSRFLTERIITKAPELPWSGGFGYSLGVGIYEGDIPTSMDVGGAILISWRRVTVAPALDASLFLSDEELPATGHLDLPLGYRFSGLGPVGVLLSGGPTIQFTPEYPDGPFITSLGYVVSCQIEAFTPYPPGYGLDLISRVSLGVSVRSSSANNGQFQGNVSLYLSSMAMGSGPNPQYASARVY